MSESVGTLVVELQRAVADGDSRAVDRLFRRLEPAVRGYDSLYRSVGVRDPDALAEARQATLIKLHGALSAGEQVEHPEAWARTVARNAARDLVRQRRRRSERTAELDPERAPAVAPLDAREPDVEELEFRMFKLFLFAAVVTRLGGRRRSERLRALMAWYMVRIAGIPADHAARRLGASELSGGGRNAVYKWAERGAAQVRKLAEADPESEWAVLLARAAGAVRLRSRAASPG